MTWEPLTHPVPSPQGDKELLLGQVLQCTSPEQELGQGRLMPPTAAPVWLVEAVMGSIESDLKRMFAVYLLGSGAGLMGQPCGGLRRAMDKGGPSFPNCFCSAGPAEPGALSIPSFLPHSQPVCRLWPPIEQAPGNARSLWAGPDLPLTVLEGPGIPSGYGHSNSKGGGGTPGPV